MKPTGPFLEVVSGAGEPDAEVEQVLGAARAWAEPSRDHRQRVAAALRAALPASPGSLPPAAWLGGVAAKAPLANAPPLANAARGGARLGRVPWLLIGGALLGALGFWLGHGAGYAAGQREAVARAGEAPSEPARGAIASSVVVRPSAAEWPAPERASTEPPPPLEPPAASAPVASPARADASTPARSRRPTPRARPTTGAEPSRELAEPSRLSFRQVLDQLRRAQQQLRNGQATMSLLLLSELDRAAGDVLLEERDATRVLALCAAGQDEAARDVARRLEHDSPRSIYGMRLEASCITDPALLDGSSSPERSE
jgi:hypothetical protein